MSRNSSTREYGEIVSIAQTLRYEWRSEHSQWTGSPFEWIRLCSGRGQMAIGEKIVSSWLALHDFNVERSTDPEIDRVVEGKRVVIRFSTQWKDGSYLFQQIRDGEYDFAVLFGISPDDAHCWIVPRTDIRRLWRLDHILSQQTSLSNTTSVRLRPNTDATMEDIALSKYGNGLHDALLSISRLTGYTPKDLSEAFKG